MQNLGLPLALAVDLWAFLQGCTFYRQLGVRRSFDPSSFPG
jgi:hypothetical protein